MKNGAKFKRIAQTAQIEQQNNPNNILTSPKYLEDKSAVTSVLNVLNSENKIKVIAEDSGLRHIETNNLVNAKRFKPKAGVLCGQQEQGELCPKESEYSLNGNRYCPTHFDDEKENLRKIGKIVCAEWAEEAA